MLLSRMPKNDEYFDLFEGLSRVALATVKTFCSICSTEEKAKHIKKLEIEADKIVEAVKDKLDLHQKPPLKTARAIFELVHTIDDIIDEIEEAVHLMIIFDFLEQEDFVPFGNLLVKAAAEIHETLLCFRTIRKNRQSVEKISRGHMEIKRIEEAGDQLYQTMLKDIEDKKRDALEPRAQNVTPNFLLFHVLDRKESVLEHLEKALDRCNTVSNLIESLKKENV